MKETFSLLLIPDSVFLNQVARLKQKVLLVIGRDYASSRAPAHLSLCSFRLKAGSGDALCAFLDHLCLNSSALKLSCHEIASFPQTGTLYLALKAPEKFQAFQKKHEYDLKGAFPPLKRNMSLASKPHITIGRNLQSSELEECIQQLQVDFQPGAFDGKVLRLMVERMGRMEMYREWQLE
jgi:2'-5' RNA ligase